ncbi:MAG TPA: cupin domain-containing protein [Thermoanaerobaculia bacterium]|nr:cupin domain-containing protein [Thermoanaerobaculia bacterium]
MLIRKLDPGQFEDSYDAKEQMFYPWNDVVQTPFGTGWLVVEPGRRTKPHNHHESETFFILHGRGKLTAGSESREVGPGDVIYFPPFGDHILENTSPQEDLHFLTIWWEDMAAVAGLKDAAAGSHPDGRQRLLAVAASSGTAAVSAAAIHARYARLCGAAVRTYADPARGIADESAALGLYERLVAAGELVVRSRQTPYCEGCRRHLEADELTGDCAACGLPATGAACRSCGQTTTAGETLRHAVCNACGKPLVRRPLARLCFDAARHEEAIDRQHRETAMSPRLRALVDVARGSGLLDLPVSRLAAAGIPVPLPGLEQQRLDPWFVRAARLLAALAPDEPPTVFLDLDQAFFYAVAMPALAAAAGAAAYAPLALVECEDAAAARFAAAPDGPPCEPPADWLPWLRRLAATVERDHGGKAPPTQAWTPEQRRFTGRLQRCVEEAAAAYQAATFSPGQAGRALSDLAAAAAELGEREQPLRRLGNRIEERNTGVALELLAAKALAIAAYPLLPEWSQRLWRCLGYGSMLGDGGDGGSGGAGGAGWEDTPAFVPTGSPIRGLVELAGAESRQG